ncbi:hypothetical protein H0H92_001373 [Tricholoma furcatifolium]|nr:hypothetical protein H0H92_001373 [Tricholoma furcatifolium]
MLFGGLPKVWFRLRSYYLYRVTLLYFYIPFLDALYARDTTHTLAIFARSHVGQTAGIDDDAPSTSQSALTVQVETSVEAFDALHTTFGEDTRIVLVGHSIGGWLSLQVLKARPAKVTGVFLLFPTLSHMRTTPNGQKLSWLFSAHMRSLISGLSYLARFLPVSILALFFPTWPLRQTMVLRTLLHSPSSVLAALHMADDEMHTVRGLDALDDWVGGQKDHVLGSFKPDLEETMERRSQFNVISG